MKEGITDLLIQLNYTGFIDNDQLIETYEWISNFIHARGITEKVNIIYHDDGERKERRAQFFSKKEKEVRLRMPELKFSYFTVSKLEDMEHAFHAFDLSFSLQISQPFKITYTDSPDYVSCGNISFGLNYGYWKEIISDSFIEKVVFELSSIINKGETKVVYGMIVKMPREKSPSFYVNGIGNFSLDDDEERSLSLYNQDKVKDKFWEPFWGNVITRKHIRSGDHYQELTKLLGENNVIKMNKDMIFFKMPLSIHEFEYGSRLHAKYKRLIHKLFLKYDAALKE